MMRVFRSVVQDTCRLFSSLGVKGKSSPTKSEPAGREFQIETPFEAYECNPPSTAVRATKDELLQYYRQMSLIRRMEMTADSLYKSKFIRGFCHLSLGQEAVSVGIQAALTKEDAIITAYRCHGFALTSGVPLRAIFAELLGKATGCSKGKGGSMHMYAEHFYGGNGIVGAQVPVGAGIAFAQKYRSQGTAATFALYGDGAANQGQVFEVFNMAKLWGLPCVFVCENNGYAMGTSTQRSSASVEYHKRAQYIPGVRVDGMDVLAVRQAAAFAKAWTAADKGPLVLDVTTYRYSGHSMSDPGTTYRTREEVQGVRDLRDPIALLGRRLIAAGFAEEAELKTIDRACREEAEAAAEAAKADPEPGAAALWEDIYTRGTEMSIVKACGPEYLRPYSGGAGRA